MEKVINLKNDEVFRHAVPYDDEIDYLRNGIKQSIVSDDNIQGKICDLVIHGKLDAMDLKIIEARYCSPMPSIRETAVLLKIPRATVQDRIGHIKSLI